MKNLLERMKPEPLAKFKKAKKEYPIIFKEIEMDLKTNYSLLRMQYNTVLEFRIHGISNSYDLTEINKLFND